jgi:hypothetical protein
MLPTLFDLDLVPLWFSPPDWPLIRLWSALEPSVPVRTSETLIGLYLEGRVESIFFEKYEDKRLRSTYNERRAKVA